MRRLAWVSLVLVASLGALGVFNIRLQRQQLETARRNAAERMSDVIRRATTYTMLRNDRAALAEIVSMIGRDPSIAGLRIVDAGGRVRLSTPPREAGHVMRVVTPIRNAPSCSSAACHAHPPSQGTLGVLQLDLSLASTHAEIRSASRQFVLSGAVAVLLTLITVGVMAARLRAAREEIAAELKRAQQQMIQAEKLTSLGKLAAVVAHEVNNPLSGILTYARLMRKWVDRGDQLQAHAADMHDSLSVIE